jgi:hypothetical protein
LGVYWEKPFFAFILTILTILSFRTIRNNVNALEQTERHVYIPSMSTCGPCSHPNRDQIDLELINGASFRRIAASFNLSLGAISRHKAHVKEMIRERTQDQREEHGGVLVSRVEKLAAAAEEILAMAKADKNLNAATGAINAATRLLELVGRLSGELASVNSGGIHMTQIKVTNINNYDDDASFAQMIGEATKWFDPHEIQRLKALAESSRTALLRP